MDLLTRDMYESIMIGDDVEITVLEVKGNTVKLGVSAPDSMPAIHSEQYVKLKYESAGMSGALSNVERRQHRV